MRFRSYMALGALALIPALALAGQAVAQSATQSAAQPMFININGQALPVKGETQVVQTAAGPMKVSTWSWHSPNGGASFEMQTSTGGAAPALALQQVRNMEYQMQAAQTQMLAMQRQMMAFQNAVFGNALTLPTTQAVVFALPAWALPTPVVFIDPAQFAAPPATPAPATPAHAPGLKT